MSRKSSAGIETREPYSRLRANGGVCISRELRLICKLPKSTLSSLSMERVTIEY